MLGLISQGQKKPRALDNGTHKLQHPVREPQESLKARGPFPDC